MKSASAWARELCDTLGFDPAVVTDVHLEAALRRRQQALGMAEAEDYGLRLAGESGEQQELLEELLVRESWFYRDQAPFDLLSDLAARRWHGHAGELRVLSAPCAGGEEPYSIAIALVAGGMAPGRISIDALDYSRRGLATAAAAVYPERAVGKLPAALRAQWLFDSGEGLSGVVEALRRLVHFHHANLLALPSTSAGARYDVVFCRNALIYLRAEARAKVLDALGGLLAPGGVLVVGHAETGLLRGRPFTNLGTATFAFEHTAAGPISRPTPAPPRATPGLRPRRARATRASTPPAAAPASEPAVTTLQQARLLADRGDYRAAAAQVTELLATQPALVEAQHLLGLIRAAEGNAGEARQCFQRALYLEPEHLPSLHHLALLAERRGDAAQARVLRQRAARLEPSQ